MSYHMIYTSALNPLILVKAVSQEQWVIYTDSR